MNRLVNVAELSTEGSRIGSWWMAVATSIKRRVERKRMERQNRRSIGELMIADDRMLADVGLTREEVEYAVRHGRLPTDRSVDGHGSDKFASLGRIHAR